MQLAVNFCIKAYVNVEFISAIRATSMNFYRNNWQKSISGRLWIIQSAPPPIVGGKIYVTIFFMLTNEITH